MIRQKGVAADHSIVTTSLSQLLRHDGQQINSIIQSRLESNNYPPLSSNNILSLSEMSESRDGEKSISEVLNVDRKENQYQMEKKIQIEEQEREIQRVAEELIFLKDVVRRLKMSLGQIAEGSVDCEGELYGQQRKELLLPTLRLSSSLSQSKITPQYKQWITQYLAKLLTDIKQIKSMFLQSNNMQSNSQQIAFIKNGHKKDTNKNNRIILNSGKNNNNRNNYTNNNKNCNHNTKLSFNDKLPQTTIKPQTPIKPYLQLIEYQIKCRLVQTVLKLCQSKNIFTYQQVQRHLNQLTLTPLDQIIANLQSHKLSTLIQKLQSINTSTASQQQTLSIEQLFYKWKTVHDQLEIINIQQIQRFYLSKKKTEIQNYNHNDNGILVIGGTGSGKTTLCLSMAGEKMIKRKIRGKSGEIENYQAADEQVAIKYKTSPFATSCTRQPAKLPAPKRYTYPQQLCLIDTAGFEQSRSGQIDIMNTLYTYQTIQDMKKLRIIIVVSEKNIGEREQQLIKFARYVGRYFRDYDQVKESILFVLTKFQSIKRLRVACDNLLKHVQLDRQSNQYKFLKHLHQSILYRECIQFKPSQQKTIFQNQYHIDPIQMDSKIRKIYKSLLKRFPFHHQYENDYINLEYSKETQDKLQSKKCYLQNMIRRLYKEGNNCYRYYLEQLLFLQTKINKLDIISQGYNTSSSRNVSNSKSNNVQTSDQSIIEFIENINSQLIEKFTFLFQDYLKTCNPQSLQRMIEIKRKAERIYCRHHNDLQSITSTATQNSMISEDIDQYSYVLSEVLSSINSLRTQIGTIVDEKVKDWAKVMKCKASWCHDVGNKVWLTAVVNFTKHYFAQSQQLQEYQSTRLTQQQQKQQSTTTTTTDTKQHSLSPQTQQLTTLINTLHKTQQKFRQLFTQQMNLTNQEINNYLISHQPGERLDKGFVKQTVGEMEEAMVRFKRLVFYDYLGDVTKRVNNDNLQSNKVIQQLQPTTTPRSSSLKPNIPSDQLIANKNSQFIISTIQHLLTTESKDIISNLQLIQQFDTSSNQHQLAINIWIEVDHFIQKVKIFKQLDNDSLTIMLIKLQNKVLAGINAIVRAMVEELGTVLRQQYEQHIPIVISHYEPIVIGSLSAGQSDSNKQHYHGSKEHKKTYSLSTTINTSSQPPILLNSIKLYNWLSKLNELQKFEQFSQFINFEIQCFSIKLKDYVSNLQRYLDQYDEEIAWMRKSLNFYNPNNNCSNNLCEHQLYENTIRESIKQCIQVSQQIKVVRHYLGQGGSISQMQSVEDKPSEILWQGLQFLRSLFYRHSRFLQVQKKSLREEFASMRLCTTQHNNNHMTNSNGINNYQHSPFQSSSTLSSLLLDYVILQQTHIQLIKTTQSHYYQTLLEEYQKSFNLLHFTIKNQSQLHSNQPESYFQQSLTNQLKSLNQCKIKILEKLISYPLEMLEPQLELIQTQQFLNKYDPVVVSKTVSLLLYFIRVRLMFQSIDSISNQQSLLHDYRSLGTPQEMVQPIDQLDDTLAELANILITVIQIARLKFQQIKQSLVGVILDQQSCQLVCSYIRSWDILSQLSLYLESIDIRNLEELEEALQELRCQHNITTEFKQFIDRSESIFYRASKHIDSIELQHLDISQLMDQPQSVNEFIKLLKKQTLFFYHLIHSQSNPQMIQLMDKLGEFIKKIEDSQNIINPIWQDELKQLQSQSNDPKNSLHKIIKLYEQHITKVSIQKTLEYKFVELKKQQLSEQIKEYLDQTPQPNNQQLISKGQNLCQQLKSYLNFLKSMRLKMVVSINDIDEIKNIEQMQKYYEKQATKSQAQRSQTDKSPSERDNYLTVDYVKGNKQNSQKHSGSDKKSSQLVKTESNKKLIQRKSVMKKSCYWQEKSTGNNNSRQSQQHHTMIIHHNVMDSSFSSLAADQWVKQLNLPRHQQQTILQSPIKHIPMTGNSPLKGINYQKGDQMSKSQSETQIRNYSTGFNNLDTINMEIDYVDQNNYLHKTSKTIQMTASTPYIFPIKGNNRKSQIISIKNIDNMSTINPNDKNNNVKKDELPIAKEFNYKQKYMADNAKRYTVNSRSRSDFSKSQVVNNTNSKNNQLTNLNPNMKKPVNPLKYSPPTLVYEKPQQHQNINISETFVKSTIPMSARITSNIGFQSSRQTKVQNTGSSQSLINQLSKNGAMKIMNPQKIEHKK